MEPTATPTEEPTATPTEEPTATPTVEPTATPTAESTPTLVPVTGHARVIKDTHIQNVAGEKAVLLDDLYIGDIVEVLGQQIDPETDWTWHQISFNQTEGFVRADTVAMMTAAEYAAYLAATPVPTDTPEPTQAPALTAQPRPTWVGTPIPAVWVSSETPSASATAVPFATATEVVTEEPSVPTEPVILVTAEPETPAGPSNLIIYLALAGILVAGTGIGTGIHVARRNKRIREQTSAAERARKMQEESDQWIARGSQNTNKKK